MDKSTFSTELFWKLYYRIPECGEFLLVESEILGIRIRNPESLRIRIHISSSADKDSGIQYLDSGIHKRGILNPRSHMGRAKKYFDVSDGGYRKRFITKPAPDYGDV